MIDLEAGGKMNPSLRLRKKALQAAYDMAIKRQMVRVCGGEGGRGVVWMSLGVLGGKAQSLPGLAWGVHMLIPAAMRPPPPTTTTTTTCACLLQEEEAAQRTGGRGLEEIAAEAVMSPEESGGCGQGVGVGMARGGDRGGVGGGHQCRVA